MHSDEEIRVEHKKFLITVSSKALYDTIRDLDVSDRTLLVNLLDYIAFGDITSDPIDFFRPIHAELPTDLWREMSLEDLTDILWKKAEQFYIDIFPDLNNLLHSKYGYVGSVIDAVLIKRKHILLEVEFVEE